MVQRRSSIGSLVGTFIVMAVVLPRIVMVVGVVGGVGMVVVRLLAVELLLNGW
jgi:nitrate reductase NapE component